MDLMFEHDVFVPNGDSAQDTAVLLVGTAAEFGLDQRSIKATSRGFLITEELADLIYGTADEPEPDPKPAKAKKSSDNRVGKNSSKTEKE